MLSQLIVLPSSFAAANLGASIARVGTRVIYRVSEEGITTFTVQRATRGVKRGRRCVRRTRGARGRSCTRYVGLWGSFRHRADAGLNTFVFTGRLRGRALRLGRYRLVAVAADASDNRSKPLRHGFRIVRR